MYIITALFAFIVFLNNVPGLYAQGSSDPLAEPDFSDIEVEEKPVKRSVPERKPAPASSPVVTYLSLAVNINDFGRFADGGSDSNWYIGFNNAWIVKLPPAPAGDYSKAFIGAKIGRSKSQSLDSPWERVRIPGKVYMAISQSPSFGSEQSFFLAETQDIPAEADPSVSISGTGRSEWFWTEVQPSQVSSEKPNYLIIWSPTREFRDAARAPILAGLEAASQGAGAEPAAWNNHSIQGVPPRGEGGTLQVPITNIRPALAVKLVSRGERSVKVLDTYVQASQESLVVRCSVEGRDVELAWVEMSQDELEWRRVSSFLRSSPFIFTLPRSLLPSRGAYFRVKARDASAAEGFSAVRFVSGAGVSDGQ